MSTKRRVGGGILAFVGFMLSPLSFWNDLIINIPLAYLFAWPFGAASETLFLPAMIVGYWLTNVAGFVLMHKGAKDLTTGQKREYSRESLLKDLAWSVAYTIIVALLVTYDVLRLPTEYFK